ncbi:MAG: hypothetical protein OEX03_12750 [Gammaproteobacteria bacterium]|nr:hypothetical protein [Gammaproteobacteria bacterium]
MTIYVIISIVSGLLFGTMDAFIHANPLARRLFSVYRPIAKEKINVVAGSAIDLAYGFILAALFLQLYDMLPGMNGLLKGISFALLVWFFRVVMNVASQWMMYTIPAAALIYSLFTGLAEMLVLGLLYGWYLSPYITI